jgi:2-amino-4-hydroxy-6-hydroxymethyldihydropteridine diphosphokinase
MTSPGPHWRPAYIAIGSNLASPEDQVRTAIDELAAIPNSEMILSSSLYRSKPMGPQDQPDFINAVAVLLSQLDPAELLRELKQVENRHGRERDTQRWGPRILDLDLLVFGRHVIESDALTVPHPGIPSRNFVLLPLHEIAPYLEIPGSGTVTKLLAALGTATPGIEQV